MTDSEVYDWRERTDRAYMEWQEAGQREHTAYLVYHLCPGCQDAPEAKAQWQRCIEETRIARVTYLNECAAAREATA